VVSGLLEAARGGDLNRVQRLIREGADVKERDADGRTVLLDAASANIGKSHATMLQWLLEEGGSSITENYVNNILGSPLNLWCLLTIRGGWSFHRICYTDVFELSSLLKVMVMLEDAPEPFMTAGLSLYTARFAEIAMRGQQLRAQLPSYLEQQWAMVVTHYPLPGVLQPLVAAYAATTPEDMWTDGLRVKAPRAKRVRVSKAIKSREGVEGDDEVAHFPRRSQRLRQMRG
jgi:hypothetical protein